MENKDQAGLDRMMGKLGDFGRYQGLQFFLHIVAAMPTGVFMLSLVTIAAVPAHRCAIEGVDTFNYTEDWNSSVVLNAIPKRHDGKLDSCHMYIENETLVECSSWVYDTQYFKSSRGMDWNFVCRRRWMGAAVQTMFMMGVVVGSIVLGPLCDKFGRKTILVWSGLFQLLFGVTVAFVTEYYTFVVIRFFYGIVAISPFKAGYVLSMELIGPSKRAVCAALFQIMFAIGAMLVGVWGYLIENRFYLQIVYALHSVILIPHWFLMDESPRWLWAQGRARESVGIAEKALDINRSALQIDTPKYVSTCIANSQYLDGTAGVTDLFRTRNMLRKTMIASGSFFAIGVVYYGLGLNTGKLNGNPFLMSFLNGFVEVPGYIIVMVFVDRIGHRALLSSSMLLSGLFLLIVVALPAQSTSATVAVMLGKLIIACSFSTIYKYAAELFPTVVRSSAVGLGTMCASLSAALAPLITLLDSFNPQIPTVVFALLSIIFGLCTLLLPETRGKKLPQSLDDGEKFGVGDTCFTNCLSRNKDDIEETKDELEVTKPLNVSDEKK